MTLSTLSAIAFAIVPFLAFPRTAHAGVGPATRPIVVVELFTSEGCSSCPPADAVLAALSTPGAVDGVEIVPLELHVDYWNRLGWADPFSSAQFSRRQEAYAQSLQHDQIYTPQMIVDGTREFVGSDSKKALTEILRAARQPKAGIMVSLSPLSKDGKSVDCGISVSGLPEATAAHVVIAVTEDELSTEVKRGENAHRTLQHASVVRSLEEVAIIKSGNLGSIHKTIAIVPSYKIDRVHVVVLVQEDKTNRVIAAVRTGLGPPR